MGTNLKASHYSVKTETPANDVSSKCNQNAGIFKV